jgi:integrase
MTKVISARGCNGYGKESLSPSKLLKAMKKNEPNNGRSSESHQACLNGRVVTDEGEANERRQYDNALHLVNYRLKELSTMLKLQRPLTMYVARHSWASAAKAKNVPLSVISEGMGHDSEATTQIYLASLETSVVDKANKMILGLL